MVNSSWAGVSFSWPLRPTSGLSMSDTSYRCGVTVRGSNRCVPAATGTTWAPPTPTAVTSRATGMPKAIRPTSRRLAGSGAATTSSSGSRATSAVSNRLTRTTTSIRLTTRNAAVTTAPAAGRAAVNSSPITSASRVGSTGARIARVRSDSVVDTNAATQVMSTGVMSRSWVTSAGSPTLSMRAQPCSRPVPRSVAVCTVGTPWSRVCRYTSVTASTTKPSTATSSVLVSRQRRTALSTASSAAPAAAVISGSRYSRLVKKPLYSTPVVAAAIVANSTSR